MHYPSKKILQSSRNGVDLLSYESKTTDKQEQYGWITEKKFGRVESCGNHPIDANNFVHPGHASLQSESAHFVAGFIYSWIVRYMCNAPEVSSARPIFFAVIQSY